MIDANELGENRIIDPKSSESEYGELDSALLRLCLMAGLGLANLDPE